MPDRTKVARAVVAKDRGLLQEVAVNTIQGAPTQILHFTK